MPNGRPQSPMWFSRITSMAEEVEHPHERVADHGRTQVPDVHLLGDVRRRVVDDDGLDGGRPAATPRRSSAATVDELLGEELGRERDVDEAGPGDLEFAGHAVEHPGVDDLLGELARVRRRAAWRAGARR